MAPSDPVRIENVEELAAQLLAGFPVDGLTSTVDSLGYRIGEVERHLHHRARWRGKKAVQGATDWAEDNLSPFRATSGNNAYGSDPGDEAQVLGSGDTPIVPGMVFYDPHKLFVIAASSTSIYKLRVVYGTGTLAAAVAALQYSEIMVKIDAAAGQTPNVPVEMGMRRVEAGTKLWIQAWNATNNATIDFFVGLHEYEG